MADIKYLITVDSSGAIKSTKDFEGALDGSGKAAEKSEPSFKSMFGAVALGSLAADVARKAFQELKGAIGDSIKGAIDQEKADRNLRAALELTGRTVEGNYQHYLNFAGAQQKVTKYADEEIQAAQALLLQVTSLNQDGIDAATKGAMGLASTMGTDLQSATMMVTKAMEGNFTALGRVGIKVDENLTAQEKQASLLSQLNTLYGRSTSEIDTLGGRMDMVKKNVGELKEAFGKILLEGIEPFVKILGAAASGLQGLIDKANEINGRFSANSKTWAEQGNLLRDIALKAGMSKDAYRDLAYAAREYDDRTQDVIKANRSVTDLFDAEQRAINANSGAVTTNIDKMLALLRTTDQGLIIATLFEAAWKKNKAVLDETGTGAGAAAAGIKKVVDAIKPIMAGSGAKLDFLVDMPDQIKDADSAWKKWLGSIVGTGKTVDTETEQVNEALEEIKDKIDTIPQKTRGAMKDTAKATADAAMLMIQQFEMVRQAVGALFGALGALSDANRDRQMQNLDSEYERRKKLIEDSLLTEEEKNAQLEALDSEFESKKLAIKRDAWVKQKNAAVADAIINTAVSVTKAWATGGPILGPILAALAVAAGAIQIAAIKAQPVPLAKGGILDRPTFSDDGRYEAGEAGREAVIPLDSPHGKSIMREAGMGQRPIIVYNTLELNGVILGEQVIEITQDAIDRRKLNFRKARFQ